MADFGQSSSLHWLRLVHTKGSALGGPGGRSDLLVTAKELKKHRKRKDAWIVLNGKVLSTFGQMN